MSPPPAHLPTEADLAAVLRASTRRRVLLAFAALAALLTLTFVAVRKGPAITAWFRGETDLRGRRRYRPARPPDRAALARIRFDRVHGELLPRWLIALQRQKTFDDRDRAEEALAALRLAIEPDPNLDAIALELDARIRGDLAGSSARVRYLLWAWSAYLDSVGVPYRVEGSVAHPRRRPAKLHFRVYRVLDDARVGVGAQRYRARLLRRVDRTNLVEADLGHTSDADEGALVVVDTVFNFAVDDVWPLLDANDDPQRPPMQRAHAAFVRIEAARGRREGARGSRPRRTRASRCCKPPRRSTPARGARRRSTSSASRGEVIRPSSCGRRARSRVRRPKTPTARRSCLKRPTTSRRGRS